MDISTHGKVLEKELINEFKNEVNVNDITMDNESSHVNVTLRIKLYNLFKEKILYLNNKIIKWMSCTTNTIEKIHEPVEIEKLKVVEVDEPVVTEEKLENIKEPFEELLETETPVQIEKPIPIEERW